MKAFLFTLLTFFSLNLMAQSPRLARSYYQAGAYEKAIELYKELHKKQAYRTDYFKLLVTSYQQLERFDLAEKVITEQLQRFPKQHHFNVELGYNYAIQNNKKTAIFYYDLALKAVENNANLGYNTGKAFKDNNLLDYALKAYKTAMNLNPKLNFDLQIALIYGEQGQIENMFDGFLNIVDKDKSYATSILRFVGKFITEDNKSENNVLFKNLLIKRLQNNPNTSWNILLSWLYKQEKRYNKAFVQEKAIFRRQPKDLSRLIELGKITFKAADYTTTALCFDFILKNTPQSSVKILSELYLIKTQVATFETAKELQQIDLKFKDLLAVYGFSRYSLSLQYEYATFLSYKLNAPQRAIALINKSLQLNLDKYQKARLKLTLADVFVYSNQLNQALITYTQVKTNYKNSMFAQQAAFKIAQTSYFKTDFEWAQTQLKVLKSETSQLIANDALKLNRLIANNTVDKDARQLVSYAKADLLAFQNKTQSAIDTLSRVLLKFKKYPIQFYALFKQAQLYEKNKNYNKAIANYLEILKLDKENILADDAVFNLALLYQNKLSNPAKAVQYFEKIIFEYPASIYLVEARKKFRQLRPELIN